MDSNPIAPPVLLNPLNKYFRQPAVYIKLPSEGEYWPDGTLNLPVTSEIPVYPMTTRDEVTLKTPDALMNGSGVVDVIHSCCPSILNAWQMPSIDVDTVLISIRIASYGNDMEFDTTCPHCKEENSYSHDLRQSLSDIQKPDYSELVDLTEHQLHIKLRPQTYMDSNKISKVGIEEQKMLQALEDKGVDPEVRSAKLQTSMKNLINIALDGLTSSTEYIITDDGQRVVDPKHILEFYQNTDSSLVKLVQERVAEINQQANIAPLNVTCGHCNNTYRVPIEFNYTSFFGKGS